MQLEQAGMDELYIMWYICPFCKYETVAGSFLYCPHCGKFLREKEKDELKGGE